MHKGQKVPLEVPLAQSERPYRPGRAEGHRPAGSAAAPGTFSPVNPAGADRYLVPVEDDLRPWPRADSETSVSYSDDRLG
jgi:hypothetical protein